MKKRDIIKGLSEIVVSAGVGTIVGSMVKSHVPADLGRVRTFTVKVATVAVAGAVAVAANNYINSSLDNMFKGYDIGIKMAEEKASYDHLMKEAAEAFEGVDHGNDIPEP